MRHEPVRAADPTRPPTPAGRTRQPRKGFFTDTSICIGCKACEVACKEWNGVPDDGLQPARLVLRQHRRAGRLTWRHVAFIEQPARTARPSTGASSLGRCSGMPPSRPGAGAATRDRRTDFRWLMSSDVCKHCTHAACLDVCPTGSLFRTEFGTVVVQDDICNGCGYCVPACPFGVIDRRIGEQGTKNVGIAQKCTLCYDRLRRRPDAGLRAGLPDRSRSSSATSTSCASGPRPGSSRCTSRA